MMLNSTTIPTITATVEASVHIVERRVLNLIHSDLTTRGKVSRTVPAPASGCEAITAGGVRVLVLIGSRLPRRTARGRRR